MPDINPLLADTELPAFSAVRAEHVVPAIDAILADYNALVAELIGSGTSRDFDHVMQPQERMETRLTRAWAPVGHLHAVLDTPALRKAHAAALERITEFSSQLGQNQPLQAATQAVEATLHKDAPTAQRAAVAHALRDFHLAGVDLEPAARERFRAIMLELAQLGSEFADAVQDATDAWTLHLPDDARLGGIPPSGVAVLREYAHDRNLDGFLVTLQQPSVRAVLTYATDRDLRAQVYRAYHTRASDQGPQADEHDNSARIERIVALRHEAAQLLGFASAAEESLATKMATTPATVMAFLRDLAARARPLAQRELDELQAFARDELALDSLAAWDIGWAAEKLRQKRYAFDAEALKPYFAVPKVIAGLFQLVERLYGITLAPRADVDTWHKDVVFYDLCDAAGKRIAGLYMDLYARPGKHGGAWMDVCRARFRDGAQLALPIAFLTCNFAPPTAAQPSLINHDDVVTLFHEFGHSLHHMLTEVDIPAVGGIDGVEWDAVEFPSQFMENFAWERGVLDLVARHYQTGERLPDELFERLLATRTFEAGMALVRQLEFALFDFRLHLEYDPARGARTMTLLEEVRAAVAVVERPVWDRFPHAFTHIFGGGYAAGYYSYLWAEVMAADAFARFKDAGVIDAATGNAFRTQVLARGATRPALDSFIAFRGRAPQPDALLASYGLTPD